MSVHMKKKSYKWKQCDNHFSFKQNLIEHEFIHTGELPYICGVDGCQMRFRQRGKLSIHRQQHSNYKKKSYTSHSEINDGVGPIAVKGPNQTLNSQNMVWMAPTLRMPPLNCQPLNDISRKLSCFNASVATPVLINQSLHGYGQVVTQQPQKVSSYYNTQLYTSANNSVSRLPKLSLILLPTNKMDLVLTKLG